MLRKAVLHYVFTLARVILQHRNSMGYLQLVLIVRNQWRYFEQGVLSVHYYTRNTHTIEKII